MVELAPAVTKWLKASGAADVAIGGISWSKVLQPNKKVRGSGPNKLWGLQSGWGSRAAQPQGGLAVSCMPVYGLCWPGHRAPL